MGGGVSLPADEKFDEAALKAALGDQFNQAKFDELKDAEGFVARDKLVALAPPAPAPAAEPAHPEPTAEAISDLQGALGADPSLGKVVYKSEATLETGLKCDASMGDFKIVVDEPEMMPGGANQGCNPLDLFLGSCGTCQEIAYKAYGTAMGLKVNKVATTFEGDVDLGGFLATKPEVGAGFSSVKGEVEIDVPGATSEQLEQLKGAVDAKCPMADTLARAVPLDIKLERVEAADASMDPKVSAEAIADLQAAFTADPEASKVKYRSSSALSKGMMTELSFPDSGHSMVVDEPEMMPGGANKGPNPLDVMLSSLGTCQLIAYKAYAAVMKVPIKNLSCKFEGDVDLAGFLGVNPDMPAGFLAVRGVVTIETSAPQEVLDQLKEAVDAHCPMVDTIRNEHPMATTYKVKA